MECDEISFVSLVEKIKENCVSLSHLEATLSMCIKYKDEDDDLVNLRPDSAAVKEILRCSRDVQGQEFRKIFLYAAELYSPAVVPNSLKEIKDVRLSRARLVYCQGNFLKPPSQSAQPHQLTPLDKLKFDVAENVQIKRVLVQSAEQELSRLTAEQNDLQPLSALKRDICDLDVPMHRARLTQSAVYRINIQN